MPRPIQVLTIREFEQLVEAWAPVRRIDEVHIHCTDRPRHAEFRGLASIEAMRRYHLSIGMADIAQHLTIDPNGLLWTGRPFDTMPASVRGHNGKPKMGPFMIEVVGLFDTGKDPFEAEQKQAVYAAVCVLLRKFGLDENAVRFHREFSGVAKTCPGSALDPAVFRSDIKAALSSVILRNFETRLPRGFSRPPLDRGAVLEGVPSTEAAYFEVPESPRALMEQDVLASWFDRGLLDPSTANASRDVEDRYRELLPHVINTSQGILSTKGKMATTAADVDNLIEHCLAPAFESGQCKRLLFYAHGGLVSEKSALEYARIMTPWWLSYGVYPVFFIWESSLFQAIWQRPRDLARGDVRGFGDFWDRFVEASTQRLARKIWKEMKENARRCSEPMTPFHQPGGLHLFVEKLAPWLASHNDNVELHAIGHSTGPILLSKFMPLLINKDFVFESLNYLAPAIRIDDFKQGVKPLLGNGIRHLRQFTMNDEAEQNDSVALIYRKSLLYYVREACEDTTGGKIMGLERDLYADQAMRNLFGLKTVPGDVGAQSAPPVPGAAPVARIEFSQDEDQRPLNNWTRSTKHGFFDNDDVTMSTVLAWMLGPVDSLAYPEGLPFPQEGLRAAAQLDDLSREFAARGGDTAADSSCCCCCHQEQRPSTAKNEFDPSFEPEPPKPEPAVPLVVSTGTGRRIALCAGINAYPRQPLGGCVQDSENWAAALLRLGFQVRTLRDREATRAGLVESLGKLIHDGREGDQLVFQFAGHGTQVDDLSGDDQDRFDEVVVPVDFDSGALLIDDDIYELCKELRTGARLTIFMDCCHSGTNTRFAPLLPASRGRGPLPRTIRLSDKDVAAYKRAPRGARSAPPVNERVPLPGVVSFAACRDDEVAWEEEGQGNFSRHSLAVFDRVIESGGTNNDFISAVRKHFGGDSRQHPQFDKPAAGLEVAPFLGGR
jgi:hypothetical protein